MGALHEAVSSPDPTPFRFAKRKGWGLETRLSMKLKKGVGEELKAEPYTSKLDACAITCFFMLLESFDTDGTMINTSS